MSALRIDRIEGTALALRGDDIDTDRIIPARYLRAVSFEGLEEYVFIDDRKADPRHPFDDPAHRGASVFLVNRNFGCGSSREHAPQALRRWGIRAIAGESFSEIFFGNAVAIGLPCVTLAADEIRAFQDEAERAPQAGFVLDLAAARLTSATRSCPVSVPEGARSAFLSGRWDATGLLLERFDEVRATAMRLPYLNNFA